MQVASLVENIWTQPISVTLEAALTMTASPMLSSSSTTSHSAQSNSTQVPYKRILTRVVVLSQDSLLRDVRAMLLAKFTARSEDLRLWHFKSDVSFCYSVCYCLVSLLKFASISNSSATIIQYQLLLCVLFLMCLTYFCSNLPTAKVGNDSMPALFLYQCKLSPFFFFLLSGSVIK